MPKQFILSLICITVLLAAAACHKVTPTELQTQLKSANPQWEGEFEAGYYAKDVPVFEFSDGPSLNAVAITGSGIRDFTPLRDICLRIFCLRNSNLKNLSFLPKLKWEPEVIIELQKCTELTDFSALKTLPLTIVSISDTPFSDTTLLGDKLNAVYLNETKVEKLNFARPEIIGELSFTQRPGTPDVDLKQINKMNLLVSLSLKNRQNIDDINLSSLQYLENLMLRHIDQVKLTPPAPHVINDLRLEDCKEVVIGEALNNKVIDRLALIRCGDPAKILEKLSNTKINMLIISGANVSDISFLKRIKDLKVVRFQDCTGLPENIQLPFVEVVVE